MDEMITETAEVTAEAVAEEPKKKIAWKDIADKITTGLLILLLASPVLVLGYIFLWFVLRNG